MLQITQNLKDFNARLRLLQDAREQLAKLPDGPEKDALKEAIKATEPEFLALSRQVQNPE